MLSSFAVSKAEMSSTHNGECFRYDIDMIKRYMKQRFTNRSIYFFKSSTLNGCCRLALMAKLIVSYNLDR